MHCVVNSAAVRAFDRHNPVVFALCFFRAAGDRRARASCWKGERRSARHFAAAARARTTVARCRGARLLCCLPVVVSALLDECE